MEKWNFNICEFIIILKSKSVKTLSYPLFFVTSQLTYVTSPLPQSGRFESNGHISFTVSNWSEGWSKLSRSPASPYANPDPLTPAEPSRLAADRSGAHSSSPFRTSSISISVSPFLPWTINLGKQNSDGHEQQKNYMGLFFTFLLLVSSFSKWCLLRQYSAPLTRRRAKTLNKYRHS